MRQLTTIAVNLAAIFLVAIAALLGWDRIQRQESTPPPAEPVFEFPPTPTVEIQTGGQVGLPSLMVDSPQETTGITPPHTFDTEIPERPVIDVTTYTVESGDSLFSIAEDFNLRPETILWGNFETLEDNPHLLADGQELNILPVDGTYYKWAQNDNLSQVASFFKVDPIAILEYPGNYFDLTEFENPVIDPGTWLIIPGGQRAIKDWGPPAISRDNPASAAYYGAGHCGAVYEGAIGTGVFVWPTTDHTISGYTYDPVIHPAIDIAGVEGSPVFAMDSGVVVYAGWSDFGYGYLIVVDHGNGWQSAYAHLSAVAVTCGTSVYAGGHIGAIGNTGNSAGAHLHFETVYNGAKVNPLGVVQ
jgi:murein DD-endopeptidase MepM/ murein hydrolase activator NlpD